MRFRLASNQTQVAITFANLLDTIVVADTAVSAFDLFDQVRINFVELWAVPALGGTTEVALEWGGQGPGATGDGRVRSDSSMGLEPAHFRSAPSKLSQAAQWQAAAATAFIVSAPQGAIVDVDCSFRTVQNLPPVGAASALVGATAGELYYRGLDGLAIAATQFVPLAPTTA